jgi:anti-sigma regulatory factor (Ser/Thr protein kinase)
VRVLSAVGLAALCDDATLLVSEIVANAVLHARSDLVLRASAGLGRVRVSVEDREGATLPRPASAGTSDDSESGWGLFLVESLSAAWGVEVTPDGKRVWFDLPEAPPEA